MNLFDGVQAAAFNVVTTTFGVPAVWTPINSEESNAANVLFKNPTEVFNLFGVNYGPETPFVEFKQTDFPGLKESVDDKGDETLVVDGVEYTVAKVHSLFDGKNYIAELYKK